jgi:type IV fimbrial biogenesis protein FimT
MNMTRPCRRHRGLTLIELMVVVALIAVVIALVAPSFRQTMDRQRVSSTNSQLVTDMQFARSEAASRNQHVRVTFGANAGMSCYVIYTYDMTVASSLSRCNCLVEPACTAAGSTEIRSVRIPTDTRVNLRPVAGMPVEFAFEPVTGALYKVPTDFFTPPLTQYATFAYIDLQRSLRTILSLSGRPTVCAPTGSKMQAPAC